MKTFLLLCFFTAAFITQAQQPRQDTLRQKALTLKRFMEKNHYQPLVWNDSASAMLFDKWIEDIDEEKLFFLQADINLLQSYKTKLDDELNGNGWKFFDASVNIYRQRLQKTDSIIKAITAKPLDFSKPDSIVWPSAGYAASEAEIILRWRRYIKWHVLNNIADEVSADTEKLSPELPVNFTQLESLARKEIQRQEERYIKILSGSAASFMANMQDAYLNSIAWCYDPHSSYMNINEKEEFETEMSASEYSAGFDLEENEKGDKAIGFLQPGGSAWRSGKLHKGDVLLKIKTNGEEKNVSSISATELESLLGGSSGSDVEVTVRTAAGEIKTVKLLKEKITDDESIVKSYVLRGIKNIGYINLPGFYSREEEGIKEEKDIKYDGCANDVSKEIVKLKKDSIAGLILDLRYNGGGSMWEAMQLSGIFIDIGPVASVKERDGKVHFLKDPNRGTIYDGPLLVLVNGASASASEFVSAVLQDYNRAIIVGGTTYGKGTAQVVLPMDTGVISATKNYEDFVKVTEEKFYRVDGSTTQWKAVVPDIELPDMYADDIFKEKANKSALQPDLSKAGMYKALAPLPIATLKTKSRQRVAADEYFTRLNSFSEWMLHYRKGRTIPLQWPAYTAHYFKTKQMFKLLNDDDEIESQKFTTVLVRNNSFDMERIAVSATKSKEVNEAYLDHLKLDKTIEEAYRIMMDWTGK